VGEWGYQKNSNIRCGESGVPPDLTGGDARLSIDYL